MSQKRNFTSEKQQILKNIMINGNQLVPIKKKTHYKKKRNVSKPHRREEQENKLLSSPDQRAVNPEGNNGRKYASKKVYRSKYNLKNLKHARKTQKGKHKGLVSNLKIKNIIQNQKYSKNYQQTVDRQKGNFKINKRVRIYSGQSNKSEE